MPLAPTLPVELWLMVFDLVLEAGITLVDKCDPIFFPDVDAHLRSPKSHSLENDAYSKLRLVCRTFHTLLGNPPHFFMKSAGWSIPIATRALHVSDRLTFNAALRQLVAGPSISNRIVKLDIACDFWADSPPSCLFRRLCESSTSLPNLRSLTLRLILFPQGNLTTSFWIRLNAAFPLLLCLILSLNLRHTAGLLVDVEHHDPITFQNLQILDLDDRMNLYSRLHFPALRHIAPGKIPRHDPLNLARMPLLESLLLRHINDGTRIELGVWSKLRLIGVPMWEESTFPPIDCGHLLEHLWIYMRPFTPSKDFVDTITRIPMRLPAVCRITFDFSSADLPDGIRLKNMLQVKELRLSGLVLQTYPVDGSRVILERTLKDSPPKFSGTIGKGGILKRIWRGIHR